MNVRTRKISINATLIALCVLLYSSHSLAEDMYDKIISACLNKEMKLSACEDLRNVLENTEAIATNTIRNLGVEEPAVILGSAAKVLAERRLNFQTTIPTGGKSQFSVGEKSVNFNVKWDF